MKRWGLPKMNSSPSATVIAFALVSLGTSACTNTGLGPLTKKGSGNLSNDSSSSSTDSVTYQISNVTVASTSGSSSSTDAGVSVFFDASRSEGSISASCTSSSSGVSTGGGESKPCKCQFSWEEQNTNSSESLPISRSVQTNVTNVQTSLVVCKTPAAFANEISNGTAIRVTVTPSGTNSSTFTVPEFTFTKNTATQSGSFQDAEGRAFSNILRYSCYEQFKRGTSVKNRKITVNSPDGDSVKVLTANQFCVAKASGSSQSAGCEDIAEPENSAQSYYYNLFIRSTDKGGINSENQRYKCPLVKEPLNTSGTVGSSNDYYPLDSNFALALTNTGSFTVGVEAYSKLGIGGDPSSQNSSCFGSGSSAADSASLVRSCLGFAAQPASDGTCPYIVGSDGLKRPTYRLRRFIALYPPLFDADGKMISETQATDTVYVLDRPVSAAGADPLRPYTMRGPKPCPFSYFDHKGVLGDFNDPNYAGGAPSYAATNNPAWTGTNIDGVEFPRADLAGNSCSAAMPLLNDDKTLWSVGTVHSTNPAMSRLFVRPVKAWAPHYEEDTDFQACAPQASPLRDPPLHFAKDPSTGNVSWCAEVYPTQNAHVAEIDKRSSVSGTFPGMVLPYTSHVVKNSASATCQYTTLDPNAITPGIPTSGYPASPASGACQPPSATTGVAHHPDTLILDSHSVPISGVCSNGGNLFGGNCYYCANQTCDRTVQNVGTDWPRFPLLARANHVESAIASDSTYSCMMTFDAGGGKTGKATPREGCCGANVRVWTGFSTTSQNQVNSSAHFEPSTNTPCLTPQY